MRFTLITYAYLFMAGEKLSLLPFRIYYQVHLEPVYINIFKVNFEFCDPK